MCFLCGNLYDEDDETPAFTVFDEMYKKYVSIHYIGMGGGCMNLCRSCTKAFAFGVSVALNNRLWLGYKFANDTVKGNRKKEFRGDESENLNIAVFTRRKGLSMLKNDGEPYSALDCLPIE